MPNIQFDPFEGAEIIDGAVTSPEGFSASGITAGIKQSGRPDVALLMSQTPAATAGLFTTNRVRAACVDICRERVAGGRAQVLAVTSGNANCYTGEQGYQDALEICTLAAQAVGVDETLALGASTGVIGHPLPMEIVRNGIRKAGAALSPDGGPDFAQAILTTDTTAKTVACKISLSGGDVKIGAAAKGSGMIEPNLATMFCFITTDADIDTGDIRPLLAAAVDQSFNCLTVDSDTSTNDMVLLMANGASGVRPQGRDAEHFQSALNWVCRQMAMAVAADGEGATKLVEVVVCGAATRADAKVAAKTIANSPLVKTALFGRDPNWGRILAAAGRSGANVQQERMSLSINGQSVVREGQPVPLDEKVRSGLLTPDRVDIRLDLGIGGGEARVWTCDFSYDYVSINAEYHT